MELNCISFDKKIFYMQNEIMSIEDANKIACESMCEYLNFKDSQKEIKNFMKKV